MEYKSKKKIKYLIVLIIITFLHTIFNIIVTSPLPQFFSKEYPLLWDYSVLTYQSMNARIFFAQNYQMWGYDSNFMAGFPLSFIWNSNVAVQVFSCVFPWLSIGIVLKLFLFLTVVSMPITLYFTFRNFEFSHSISTIGVVLGVLYFNLGLPFLFVWSGMITTHLLIHISLYLFSIIYQVLKNKNINYLFLLFLMSALVLLIHKTAVVVLCIPSLILFILYRKNLSKITYICVLFLILFILLFNSFWLQPTFKFIRYKDFLEYAPFWQNYNLSKPIEDYFSSNVSIFPGKPIKFKFYGWIIINNLLLWPGIAGIVLFIMKKNKIGITFLISSLFFFLFSYYGSFWNFTAVLNPYRYIANLNYFLVIPATFSFHYFLKSAKKRFSLTVFKLIVLLILFLIVILYLSNPWFRMAVLFPSFYENPVKMMEFDNPLKQLIEWINEYTNENGRILIEGSGWWDREGGGEQYYQTYLTCVLHFITRRQFIGGPYPYIFLKHNFANFHGGRLFDRNVELFPLKELKKYFDLYNISTIIAWSKKSNSVFCKYPQLIKKIKTIDKYTIYKVDRKLSFFYKGEGSIKTKLNSLLLNNLVTKDGEIIIKYHWLETLKANPQVEIDKIHLLDDPINFIKIKNPPTTLKIYNF